MEHFELNNELMKKAKTYMPLAQKTVLAETIARMCIKKLKPLNEKNNAEDFILFPSVVGEDIYKKEQMLLNVLLSHYFDIKVPIMDNKLYDKYMGSHIINQLERVKNNPEYKTKAFDILTDFKTIRKMVETEIYNIKTKENDILERFMNGVSLFSLDKMTNAPQYLKKMEAELKKFVEMAKAKSVVEETVETVANNETVADEQGE